MLDRQFWPPLRNGILRWSPQLTLPQWLGAVLAALRQRFADAGYRLPAGVQVAFTRTEAHIAGQCHAPRPDGVIAVRLSFAIAGDDAEIIAVIAHECCHAAIGHAAGHGPSFVVAMRAIGLTGPPHATSSCRRTRRRFA
jgi:hypothetical protein